MDGVIVGAVARRDGGRRKRDPVRGERDFERRWWRFARAVASAR